MYCVYDFIRKPFSPVTRILFRHSMSGCGARIDPLHIYTYIPILIPLMGCIGRYTCATRTPSHIPHTHWQTRVREIRACNKTKTTDNIKGHPHAPHASRRVDLSWLLIFRNPRLLLPTHVCLRALVCVYI